MAFTVRQLESFARWHQSIIDLKARVAIARRIDRAETGNFGDFKSVGDGVAEMRIDVGAGYRVYYTMRDRMIVFLLAGGTKKTQDADIKRAKKLAAEI